MSAPFESAPFAYPKSIPPAITMSVADWIAVTNNPRQRDTDRHLATARHLRTPNTVHLYVNAGRLPDGSLIKLDGHTRARWWQLNPDLAPSWVHVTIHPVSSIEEAKMLYRCFDSKGAVDTATDDLSSAFRESQFEPKSTLFRLYKGASAIKFATSCMLDVNIRYGVLDIYDCVAKWIPELQTIDSIGATPNRFNGAMITAALLTIRRRGENAITIWDCHQRDAGVKTETEMDGVEALSRLLMTAGGSGTIAQRRSVGRSISCFEAAFASRHLQVSGGVKGISPEAYCRRYMRREMRSFEHLLADARQDQATRARDRKAVRKLILDNRD